MPNGNYPRQGLSQAAVAETLHNNINGVKTVQLGLRERCRDVTFLQEDGFE